MQQRPDYVRLKDLRFWGRHGHLPFEKELGNRFEVDVDLQMDASQVIQTDHLHDTVDLARVYDLVRARVEGEPCQLLETLAGRIAGDLAGLDHVAAATVRVRKMFPPLEGNTQGVMEVEVTRVP
ncbi:MAG: dihydroneopterin aldolase [Candidatus Zixiibacteriota bacterium]|nr:MAG: dihydroneopterin aldolase [candidate division Zixibacteria bacterium]